jgi:hypothetical protein
MEVGHKPWWRQIHSFALLGVAGLAATCLMWLGMPAGAPSLQQQQQTGSVGAGQHTVAVEMLMQANEDPLAVEVLRLRHELVVQGQLITKLKRLGATRAQPRTSLAFPPAPPFATAPASLPRVRPTQPLLVPILLPLTPPPVIGRLWAGGDGSADLPPVQQGPTEIPLVGSAAFDADGKVPVDSAASACPAAATEVLHDNTITVYVQNPRTGSLFMSGPNHSSRLARWGSGKYTYKWLRTKELTPRPTANLEAWLDHACNRTPGLKIVVYDSGSSPNWWLSNWPASTVLVMTGDEMGRWGTRDRNRYFGPFATDRESFFYHNDTSPHKHILLPPTITPWYRQYFGPKQDEAFHFGVNTLYIPLGSRVEFPDIDPAAIKPAHERKYIYSLMAALTDASRHRLNHTLNTTTLIPEDRGYMHIASKWHPELTNEEYVPPEQYAKLMQDSIFAPCPKGRAMDTFRMYEALESGAIPVIELDDGADKGYAKRNLPPHYFDSPMLFVETWDAAPAAMMDLVSDSTKLLARQSAVLKWHDTMMRTVVRGLEELLEKKRG